MQPLGGLNRKAGCLPGLPRVKEKVSLEHSASHFAAFWNQCRSGSQNVMGTKFHLLSFHFCIFSKKSGCPFAQSPASWA